MMMTKSDLDKYNTIAIVERWQPSPFNEYSWRYLGEKRAFDPHNMHITDLVLELYNGELRIIKNRYGRSSGTLQLPDEEMAKLLLVHG